MGTWFLAETGAARYIELVYFFQFIIQMTIILEYTKKIKKIFVNPDFWFSEFA